MSALRETRWKATIEVEFVTRDYPGAPESATAEIQASLSRRATALGEKTTNVLPRPQVRLVGVDRV